MNTKRTLGRIVEFFVALVVLSLIASQALGQPILFAFVETGSMQPTLDAGDGFIAVPNSLAGAPEAGDVIVFRAEELQGGGLVTHRVVEVTDQGYITKGDANNALDQQTGEPPVKDAQVVAHALQVNGEVISIPQLQVLITGPQTVLETTNLVLETLFGIRGRITMERLPYIIFVLSVLLYGGSVWRERSQRPPSRDRSRDTGTDVRSIMLLLTAFIVIVATGAMVLPGGGTQYDLIATQSPPDGDSSGIVELGASTERTHRVSNAAALPVVVQLEPGSSGTGIEQKDMYVESGEMKSTTVELQAPEETGYYRYYVVEHWYLALLPHSTIRALYYIHPWLPIIVIDALIAIPFYVFGITLGGGGSLRSRKRKGIPYYKRLLNRYT
jgi:signal peptidase